MGTVLGRGGGFLGPPLSSPCPPQVYVLKRPHVDEFLQRMGELFECVLFTASLAKVGDAPPPKKNIFAPPSSGVPATAGPLLATSPRVPPDCGHRGSPVGHQPVATAGPLWARCALGTAGPPWRHRGSPFCAPPSKPHGCPR